MSVDEKLLWEALNIGYLSMGSGMHIKNHGETKQLGIRQTVVNLNLTEHEVDFLKMLQGLKHRDPQNYERLKQSALENVSKFISNDSHFFIATIFKEVLDKIKNNPNRERILNGELGTKELTTLIW